ncbi:MAG: hypothetical protein V1918_10255 [Planctomycetota bacterium]
MKRKLRSAFHFLLLSGLLCAPLAAAEAKPQQPSVWQRIKTADKGLPAEKRIVPSTAFYVASRQFSLEYALREGLGMGVRVTRVELFVTTDLGITWTRHGEDPDAQSPFIVSLPEDGVYGFAIVTTDSQGMSERPPVAGLFPEQVVVVDTVPPAASFPYPAERTGVGERGLPLAWETQDAYPATRPVMIEFSADDGATWNAFLVSQPPAGKSAWLPPSPPAPSYRFRLTVRDRAGNQTSVPAPGLVLTDDMPPVARLTGPARPLGKTVDLEYSAGDDGGSGLAWIELWTTENDGRDWTLYNRNEGGYAPLRYTNELAGRVGLRLRAGDKAGNATFAPQPGEAPELTLVFDAEGPVFTELDLPGQRERQYRAGSVVDIGWTVLDPNPAENSVALYFSADLGQTWEAVVSDMPGQGVYHWAVPSAGGKALHNCLVRLTAQDRLGNASEAQSPQPFSILPTLAIAAPPTTVEPTEPEEAPLKEPVIEVVPRRVEPMRHPSELEGLSPESSRPAMRFLPIEKELPPALPAPAPKPEKEAPIEVLPPSAGLFQIPPSAPPVVVRPLEGLEAIPREMKVPPVVPEPLPEEKAEVFKAPPAPESSAAKPAEALETLPREMKVPPTVAEMRPVEKPSAAPEAFAPLIQAPPAIEKPAPAPRPVEPAVAAPAGARAQAEFLLRQAEVALEDREYVQARLRAREALEVDPNLPKALLVLARVAAQEKKADEALLYVEGAVAKDPNNADAWMDAGEISLDLAKKAQVLYDEGVVLRAEPAEIQEAREKLHRHLNDTENAFRKAATLRPDFKAAYDRLGEAYYFEGQNAEDRATHVNAYRNAVEAFDAAYGIGRPTYSEAFHLGVIHYRLNELDVAERYLKTGLNICPPGRKPRECLWYLAEIETSRNHLDDAIAYWEKTAEAYASEDPDQDRFRQDALKELRRLKDIRGF